MIPSGWSIKKASEICDVRDGTHDSPSYYREGVPLITSKNIKNGGISLDDVKYISPIDAEKINKRSKVDKNDIILSMIGTVGEVALIRSEPSFCIKNVALFKPSQEILPEFLLYYFQSPTFKGFIRSQLDGGIQKFLSLGSLRDLNIPVPQKREQEKIAKILSTWDEAIEKLDSQIKKMELRFEWFLSNLLSPQKSKETKQVWKRFKLSDLAQFINGRGFKQSEWSSSGLPIIRIQNLNGSSEFNYYDGDYDERHHINTGDLLFSWSGNRGTSFGPNIWGGNPGLLNQHIFKVKNTSLISKEFLYLVLKYATKIIESKAHGGSGLVHVTKSELERFEVDLPGTSSDFLLISNLLLGKEVEIKTLKRKLDLVQLQKQGLMQQLLTGKRRVKV